MAIKNKNRNMLDGTTWEFLKIGWWFVHLAAIALLLYLGMFLD